MIEKLSKRLPVAALIFAAAAALAPISAYATPPTEAEVRSRTLYAQAEALANAANWDDACPLFQAAHDLHPTGGTAIRCADCYEKVAKYERALEFYKFIVDHRDTDRSAERVAIAERRVEALRRQLGLDKPAVPPPGPPGPAGPLGPPVGVQPLPPRPPVGPQPPPLPPPPPEPNRVPGIVLVSVGGVGVVIGAILGGVALSKASTVKNDCPGSPAHCNANAAGDKSTADAFATGADIGLFVGGAAAVTGIVLLAAGLPKASSAVTQAVGPRGLTLKF